MAEINIFLLDKRTSPPSFYRLNNLSAVVSPQPEPMIGWIFVVPLVYSLTCFVCWCIAQSSNAEPYKVVESRLYLFMYLFAAITYTCLVCVGDSPGPVIWKLLFNLHWVYVSVMTYNMVAAVTKDFTNPLTLAGYMVVAWAVMFVAFENLDPKNSATAVTAYLLFAEIMVLAAILRIAQLGYLIECCGTLLKSLFAFFFLLYTTSWVACIFCHKIAHVKVFEDHLMFVVFAGYDYLFLLLVHVFIVRS